MLKKYFSMAFESLILNKIRSFLTTLGIIIGVFSVIVMIGFGQASQSYITDQVKGLGAGVLIVTPGNPKTQSFGPPGTSTVQTITTDDAELIKTMPGIKFVSPNAFIQNLIEFEGNNVAGIVLGTSQNIQSVRGLEVSQGRFFTEQEARAGTKVIVIEAKIAEELFAKKLEKPLGSKIKIGTQRYRIIGVLKLQGSGLFGSVDDQTFMPTKTFQQNVRNGKGLNSIFVKVNSENLLVVTEENIRNLLRYRHFLREDEEDDFKIQTQAELLKTVSTVTQVFTFLLAGIAAISLIVGGIGIMNIMLVSVTERTREIGVRRAVGARRRDILIQFLIESASISLIGGCIGIFLGLTVTFFVTKAVNLPFIISPASVIGGFLFSAGVGIFFGLYPANKASKLDPVDALRYE